MFFCFSFCNSFEHVCLEHKTLRYEACKMDFMFVKIVNLRLATNLMQWKIINITRINNFVFNSVFSVYSVIHLKGLELSVKVSCDDFCIERECRYLLAENGETLAGLINNNRWKSFPDLCISIVLRFYSVYFQYWNCIVLFFIPFQELKDLILE